MKVFQMREASQGCMSARSIDLPPAIVLVLAKSSHSLCHKDSAAVVVCAVII